MTTRSTDHRQRGLQKLLWQFQRQTTMALLATWLDEVQQTEDFIWTTVDNAFNIESTYAFVLERIGKIVGRGRNDMTLEAYRVALRAQIRINRSSGTIEDLLDVARLSVNNEAVTFTLTEPGTAAVQIVMHGGLAVPVLPLFANLVAAKAGGVRLEFVFQAGGEDDNDFQFSATPQDPDARDFSDTSEGFGSETDATVGGHFTGVFVS